MEFTINSRKMGEKITFSVPGNGYIFVDLNGSPGSLGRQICKGGRLMGSTLYYSGECRKEFSKICRNWWKGYIKDKQ